MGFDAWPTFLVDLSEKPSGRLALDAVIAACGLPDGPIRDGLLLELTAVLSQINHPPIFYGESIADQMAAAKA